MASISRMTKAKVRMKQKKAGRSRKKANERNGTTPTKAAFFGDKK